VPSAHLTPDFDPLRAPISFDTSGSWKANDGCNHLTGQFSVDGDGSDFSSLHDTVLGVGCDNEVDYDQLLGDVDHVAFPSDTSAVFRSPGGKLILRLVRSNAPQAGN
jgi:hypothetical protein